MLFCGNHQKRLWGCGPKAAQENGAYAMPRGSGTYGQADVNVGKLPAQSPAASSKEMCCTNCSCHWLC